VHSGEGERGTELFGFFLCFLQRLILLHLHALSLPLSLKTLRKEGRMDGWMDG